MKAFTRLIAAAAIAVPFAVGAQTSTTTTTPKGVTPADQPTSQTEKEAQSKTGQANKASGLSGAENMPSTDSSHMHKNAMRHATKKAGTTDTDTSTYPTPAKDGTTTKQ